MHVCGCFYFAVAAAAVVVVLFVVFVIGESSARNGKLQICARQMQRIVNYCNFYEFTQFEAARNNKQYQ